jgi:hypothetical protein
MQTLQQALLQQISSLLLKVDPRTSLMEISVLFICHQHVYVVMPLSDALRAIANNEHAARIAAKVRLDYPGAKHPT